MLKAKIVVSLMALTLSSPSLIAGVYEYQQVKSAFMDKAGIPLSIYPGRGWMPQTATLVGNCLEDVEYSDTTGDIFFEFELIDQTLIDSYKYDSSAEGSFKYGAISGSADIKLGSEGSSEENNVRILATAKVQKYGSAIRNSKIKDAARELLENGELIKFHKACGSDYINSVARESYIAYVLHYHSTDSEHRTEFEANYEGKIQLGFFESKVKGSMSSVNSGSEHEEELRIQAVGRGINPDYLENAIITSMDEFAEGVAKADILLKGADVGIPIRVETTSWTDHEDFMNALNEKCDSWNALTDEEREAESDTVQAVCSNLTMLNTPIFQSNADFLAGAWHITDKVFEDLDRAYGFQYNLNSIIAEKEANIQALRNNGVSTPAEIARAERELENLVVYTSTSGSYAVSALAIQDYVDEVLNENSEVWNDLIMATFNYETCLDEAITTMFSSFIRVSVPSCRSIYGSFTGTRVPELSALTRYSVSP